MARWIGEVLYCCTTVLLLYLTAVPSSVVLVYSGHVPLPRTMAPRCNTVLEV